MSSQPGYMYPSTPSNPTTAPPSSDTTDPSETTLPKDKAPNTTTTTSHARLTALEARKATLTQTLSDLKAQRETLATQAQPPLGTSKTSGEPPSDDEILQSALQNSNAVIKQHIALLHKYNEIKDVGQGLMGLIADQRDCRVVEVMEEFGVGEGD